MNNLEGKSIILGITGSIAAYKAPLIVRELVSRGAEVQCVATRSALQFVSSLALQNLSRKPVIVDMFEERTQQDGSWHIHAARSADAMLIAPCSATTIARLATGNCETPLTLIALALPPSVPLIIAPAMDTDMWEHPALRRSLSLVAQDGAYIIEPEEGELASGLVGKGRLPAPSTLVDTIETIISQHNTTTMNNNEHSPNSSPDQEDALFPDPVKELIFAHRKEAITMDAELELQRLKEGMGLPTLAGKKVLITAGPTYEPLDAVRFIGNYSSGKMGFALAEACREAGAGEVVLVSGPVSLPTPAGVRRIDVQTAAEMFAAVEVERNSADIAIFAAAVADFTPAAPSSEKTKKSTIGEQWELHLVATKDILGNAGANKRPGQIIVGFALETEAESGEAERKLQAKNCDLLVFNMAGKPQSGFGGDDNTITILHRDGTKKTFPPLTKRECAAHICREILHILHK